MDTDFVIKETVLTKYTGGGGDTAHQIQHGLVGLPLFEGGVLLMGLQHGGKGLRGHFLEGDLVLDRRILIGKTRQDLSGPVHVKRDALDRVQDAHGVRFH